MRGGARQRRRFGLSIGAAIGTTLLLLGMQGCRSVYYDAWEAFGKQKRHLLVDRVEDGRQEQAAAQAQFQSAFEAFQAATGFDGGDLEQVYERLQGEYDACEARAEAVRGRIGDIERVAADLFAEWEEEIGLISNPDLRRRSADRLRDTQLRYRGLIGAMKKAERRMDPVLVAFRDQVLFLKHNLNARAIASLETSVVSIESDVAALVADMQTAIDEAESFLDSLQG